MIGFIQKSAEHYFTELLSQADVRVNGNRPWDITVTNSDFFDRIAACGSLGLGESYMDGWWDSKALDQFFFKILRHHLDRKIKASPPILFHSLKAKLMNCQSRSRAFQVGEKHYDTGNDLFEQMLDPRMVYSCGYWNDADNLECAQEEKLDLICRKIGLQPGMRVLDIGCGWGSFVRFAARRYGVEAVGLTVSREQAKMARERCAGLPIDILVQDYRETKGSFDAIVSIGMFEHVGYKNYRKFMQVARRCLKENGLFLLHTIATNRSTSSCDPWFDRYIFPNGMLPSIKQIGSATERYFVMEDWHNLGVNYDKTLMAWHENFEQNRQKLRDRYDERFSRMWRYYLLSLAGSFRARYLQVWQIVFSPEGCIGGYASQRCPECID